MDRPDSHQIQAAVHRAVGEPTSIENLTISSASTDRARYRKLDHSVGIGVGEKCW